MSAIALWVKGYVLCDGCSHGSHGHCVGPCMCDIRGCGPTKDEP